jgi:hypothetical protein
LNFCHDNMGIYLNLAGLKVSSVLRFSFVYMHCNAQASCFNRCLDKQCNVNCFRERLIANFTRVCNPDLMVLQFLPKLS